ncbi:MAG: ribose-5-phosphate isomerase RpiA [Hadesarchaea archaeon]|nr:ribose-5-phosphate isomerase RpiA [Hadesarchaea archaeon]
MGQEEWKRLAADQALDFVKDSMVIGLGSGTTLEKVIEIIGEKESKATFVSSSSRTQELVEKFGLHSETLNNESELDLVIDGADEVAPDFSMIKGGGGAHTQEKIIAAATDEILIVIDKTKLVEKLGEKRPVPIEVIPFSLNFVTQKLRELNVDSKLRETASGDPFKTDNKNYILDANFGLIEKPARLESRLNNIPGVVDNGIFVNLADKVLVGHEGGCEVLSSERDFQDFYQRMKSSKSGT